MQMPGIKKSVLCQQVELASKTKIAVAGIFYHVGREPASLQDARSSMVAATWERLARMIALFSKITMVILGT